MRPKRHIASLIRGALLGVVASVSLPSSGNALSDDAYSGMAAYPGEYVVTISERSSTTSGSFSAASSESRLTQYGDVTRRLTGGTLVVRSHEARITPSSSRAVSSLALALFPEDEFCKQLIGQGVVTSCTPNYQVRVAALPVNDPLAGSLWGLSSDRGLDVERAWDVTAGSSDVVVAVIDTGVDYNHPDLSANMWTNPGEVAGNGVDDDSNGYVDDVHGVNTALGAAQRGNPFDDNGHGTHVAGTIGAVGDNSVGVVGVNQTVKIMALKFMDASGAGRLSDAIAAIDYMVNMKAVHGINVRVSNNSWGGGSYSPALHAAIDRARAAGIVFVVAAGNSAVDVDTYPSYPASYEVSNVVSVTAIDQEQNLASFANYGAEGVDIAAPGVGILSTLPGNRYGYLSGTSMAAPHASGALGLLFAAQPALSFSAAITRLYESGKNAPSFGGSGGSLPLSRTRRVVNAGRLLLNETAALPPVGDGLPTCGYTFQVANVASGVGIDTSADSEAIIHQSDEGGFHQLDLPFEFPFFRTATSTLYVSPNGLVYLNNPQSVDYEVAQRAPNNSIAALHADLTPRGAQQGVRVYKDVGRVTIAWHSEHYSLGDRGPMDVRLTLFPSGYIHSSVSFDRSTDPIALSRLMLGNPFSSPAGEPLGLIGVSATSSRLSNTLNLLSAQQQVVSSESEPLALGVWMVPNCFDAGGGERITTASVSRIRLRSVKGGNRLSVSLRGEGTGKVPLSASVSSHSCRTSATARLVDGRGALTLPIPAGATRIRLQSGGAVGSIKLRAKASRVSRRQGSKMCGALLKRFSR